MKSMTGYGKGVATGGGFEVTIEARSVNNRFLEVNTRLPKSLLVLDDVIRGVVSKFLTRGSVDVFFNYAAVGGGKGLSADIPLIKEYSNLAKKIQAETGIVDDLTFSVLLDKGLVITELKNEDTKTLLSLTESAIAEALRNLDTMRFTEGLAIQADLLKLTGALTKNMQIAAQCAPAAIEAYREKIKERIAEHLSNVAVDEARLINEVAFFADKTDVNEEIQRLSCHITQFNDAAGSDGASGRKLDFICQEMGREVNTLGSKSGDLTLTGAVVEMKNILEKIKEQIRNIE